MKRQRLKTKKQNKKFDIKPLVIILGEGETEESYIKRLNEIEYFKNVRLKFEKGDENNFESKLKEHLNNSKNVLLLLDIDNQEKSTLRYDVLKNLIENKPKQVYYNNFSFETCLINHKALFAKPITDKKQYDFYMKKHYDVESWSSYKNKSNRTKVMSQIEVSDIDAAYANIKTFENNNWSNNPSSNCSKIIDKIIKIGSE